MPSDLNGVWPGKSGWAHRCMPVIVTQLSTLSRCSICGRHERVVHRHKRCHNDDRARTPFDPHRSIERPFVVHCPIESVWIDPTVEVYFQNHRQWRSVDRRDRRNVFTQTMLKVLCWVPQYESPSLQHR